MHRLRSPSRAAALAMLSAAIALVPRAASGFHDGGAGACDGCHTIHSGGTRGSFLLGAEDPSSVCLNCHAGAVQRPESVLTTSVVPGLPPVNFTPGGDFGWVRKTYQWIDAKGLLQRSLGERHGHNVVALAFGLASDAQHLVAPGGTYSSSKLSCISCHDPHGRYRLTDSSGTVSTSGLPIRTSGSYANGVGAEEPSPAGSVGVYRLLGGAGYQPKSAGEAPFSAPPPIAIAPSTYNRSERTAQVRVAYGARMSEWCANCHGPMHTTASTSKSPLLHPSGITGRFSSSVVYTYNKYVKDGELTGSWSSSYTSTVPYEEGTTNRSALASHARSDGSAMSGPGTGVENVMCLSCHRAHASGWDYALRWNTMSPFLVVGGQWPGVDAPGDAANASFAQGRTQAETRGAMYDHDPSGYASFQKSLCNKCHGK